MTRLADQIAKGRYWTISVSCATGCEPFEDLADPCRNCWARSCIRIRPQVDGRNGFRPTFHADWLPRLRTKKPEVVFANIMGDWQHKAFSEQQRDEQVLRMGATPWSVFLTCTKRAGRLAEFWKYRDVADNIWNGITAWNLPSTDGAMEVLTCLPGHTWLSLEPLLGDITRIAPHVDGVFVGPETGSNRKRRPCPLNRIAKVVEACALVGVPCWVKAIDLGSRVSHDPAEWPEDLRVRQLPPEMERILRPVGAPT